MYRIIHCFVNCQAQLCSKNWLSSPDMNGNIRDTTNFLMNLSGCHSNRLIKSNFVIEKAFVVFENALMHAKGTDLHSVVYCPNIGLAVPSSDAGDASICPCAPPFPSIFQVSPILDQDRVETGVVPIHNPVRHVFSPMVSIKFVKVDRLYIRKHVVQIKNLIQRQKVICTIIEERLCIVQLLSVLAFQLFNHCPGWFLFCIHDS
mmetsp:Transcript_27442/g.66635  ORF Transcript_27442/g.66635 Transcript_27442/m.66635 type:complete len:204 (-) Transcript_27442:601-1212(-)